MIRRASPGHPAPHPVRLDRRTVILRRGAVVRILGGDPVTLVTPSPEAAALLDGGSGATGVVSTDSPAGAALARALPRMLPRARSGISMPSRWWSPSGTMPPGWRR